MPIALSRTGATLTVTITVNVADILAASGLSAAEKKMQGVLRAVTELSNSIQAAGSTDADIDAEAAARKADIDAEAAARKTARATGGF